ncbi:hypothetical protein Dimus_012099 [Dionaea muscipula]
MHKYCLLAKFSKRKVNKVCPGCSSQWPYTVTKMEALMYQNEINGSETSQPPEEHYQRKSRFVDAAANNAPSGRPKLRRRKLITSDVAADAGCGSSQGSTSTITSLRRTTRSMARLR